MSTRFGLKLGPLNWSLKKKFAWAVVAPSRRPAARKRRASSMFSLLACLARGAYPGALAAREKAQIEGCLRERVQRGERQVRGRKQVPAIARPCAQDGGGEQCARR